LDVDVTAALAAAGSSHVLQLWSAEQPSLYLLLIKLTSGSELLEVEGCQVRGTTCVVLTDSRKSCVKKQIRVLICLA
jgi:hypothetical protein